MKPLLGKGTLLHGLSIGEAEPEDMIPKVADSPGAVRGDHPLVLRWHLADGALSGLQNPVQTPG